MKVVQYYHHQSEGQSGKLDVCTSVERNVYYTNLTVAVLPLSPVPY